MPIIFGTMGDSVPAAFLKDREQLSGRPFDPQAMKAAVEPLKGQWRAQAGWIEQQLRSGGTLVVRRPAWPGRCGGLYEHLVPGR